MIPLISTSRRSPSFCRSGADTGTSYSCHLFFVLLVGVLFGSAAAPLWGQPQLDRTYLLGGSADDAATGIVITTDGGWIVAGTTQSNDGSVEGALGMQDVWVIKFSSEGESQWQRVLGGSRDDFATAIIQSSDGGYLVVGFTKSGDGDVPAHPDKIYHDIWVLKLSDIGVIEWSRTFGGSSTDMANSIAQTIEGDYIIAGATASHDGDVVGKHGADDTVVEDDVWVLRISGSGELLWKKTLGGTGNDEGNTVAATSDGGCIIAGETASNDGDVAPGRTGKDVWCVKLSAAGDIEWEKTYGGFAEEWGESIIETGDGGYVFTGNTASTDGDLAGIRHENMPQSELPDFWIVHLNSAGEITWQDAVGGTGIDLASSVIEVPGSGYVVTGYTTSNDYDVTGNPKGQDACWIVRFDHAGDMVWQKSIVESGSSWAEGICRTADGGYVTAGSSLSHDGVEEGTDYDYWIVQLKPDNTTSVSDGERSSRISALDIYPNPAVLQAVAEFRLDHPAGVELAVVNAGGVLMNTPVRRQLSAGPHTITVDLSAFPSGLYYLQLKDETGVQVKSVVVVR